MKYWLIVCVLVFSCGKMNNQSSGGFPPIIRGMSPFHPDMPETVYISDWEAANYSGRVVPRPYSEFIQEPDASLARAAKKVQNPALREWILSLEAQSTLLEIHDNSQIRIPGRVFGDFYIQFHSWENEEEWRQKFPSFGITLELLPDSSIPDSLPAPLRDLFQFGRIYLNGSISSSGFFYHPEEIKPVREEEWLWEFVSDTLYQSLGYPLEDLKAFYTDSGCWLMYDSDEQVYCGGVECGDFYRSSMNLEEVMENIFRLATEGKTGVIEAFAPK